ncbi:MAG: M23 family metallopeptidase [Cyanobacteria bacterium P01_A01_bin.135]
MRAIGLWSLCAILLLSSPSAAIANPKGTAATRPFFQAPFPCGQVWEARTYDSHSPDQDSIDLSEFDSNRVNTSDGRAVVASAAGTVIKSQNTGQSGGWGIAIDHGGGWITANSYHMQEDIPWPIAVGQKVAQGEQLGRTGKTGATTVLHQHYTQLDHYDPDKGIKNAVRVKFNGSSIRTHADNPDEWRDGERIMSQNCAGNSFMGWHRGGRRYHLVYKPSNGATKILRMNSDGSVTTTYDKTWSKGWTHFAPFKGASGQPHAIAYKQATGEVKFLRLGLGGDSVTTLSSGKWAPGWTHFIPFSKNGERYFLAYDSVHGYANIDRIVPSSNGAETVYSRTWIKGRTAIVPYAQGSKQYLFLYKGGDGAAKIVELTGTGDNISTSPVWDDEWSTGYSTLVPISHRGEMYLFGYKAETGFAKIMKFNRNGQGVRTIKTMNWTKSWTAFSPYFGNGDGYLLIYKIGTGEVKTLRLKPDANGFDTVWSGSWTLGWT